MSEDIRKYVKDEKWFEQSEDLHLTALVGGEEYGHSIQFTIGGNFIVLTQSQLLDLVSTIAKRIDCKKGFTATGHTDLKKVLPSGDIILDEEDDFTRFNAYNKGASQLQNEKKEGAK